MIGALGKVIERVGCAVVLVHHTGWTRKGYPRGSSAWLDLTDIMIRLHWKDDVLIASNPANRLMKSWKAKGYESVPVGHQRVIVPRDGEVPVDKPRVVSSDRDDAVLKAIMELETPIDGASPSRIADHLNIKVNIVNKALGRLKAANKVQAEGGQYKSMVIPF